jgi:uncharacterized membrane protein
MGHDPHGGIAVIRELGRWLLAVFYFVAGVLHLVSPEPIMAITPAWVKFPWAVVALTGLAEVIGALALVQWKWPVLRRAGGIGLALYALCVWPANFQHLALDLAREDGGLGLGYHVPRLAFQPVLVWLAIWAGEATDWPFTRPADT